MPRKAKTPTNTYTQDRAAGTEAELDNLLDDTDEVLSRQDALQALNVQGRNTRSRLSSDEYFNYD